MKKIVRNTAAGVLIAAMPISASVAATRPSAAVPAAASAAAVQDYDDDRRGSAMAWPALAVIAGTLLLGILIVLSDDDGEGSISRA